MAQRSVTMVSSRFRDGGVERRMNRLAAGFMARGVSCTFVLGEPPGEAAGAAMPSGVRVKVVGRGGLQAALSQAMRDASEQENAVLAFRTVDYSRVMRICRMRRSTRTRVFLVHGDYITERLQSKGVGRFKAWKNSRRLFREWSQANGVITTCPEIASDWLNTGAFPPECVHTPSPPVVGADLDTLGAEPVVHPWADGQWPLVLGVGRLTPNKRFDLLIEAFADLRRQTRARLVILGEGPERARLQQLVESHGVGGDVDLPGFSVNPYAWMRTANVLALPSAVEPFGLVLIEALYMGTSFVAATTPPGPQVIRNATGQGKILPSDTPSELCKALVETIEQAPSPSTLRAAVAQYDSDRSADEYLRILFPEELTQDSEALDRV